MAIRFRTWRKGRVVWLMIEDSDGGSTTFPLGYDEAERLRAALLKRLAACDREFMKPAKAGRRAGGR